MTREVRGRRASALGVLVMFALPLLSSLPLSGPAGATSSWTQAGSPDFASGTAGNVSVSGTGAEAVIVLARTETFHWSQKWPPASPPPRSHHALAPIPGNGTVLLFGGWDGVSSLDDTWLYSPSNGTWDRLEPVEKPPARDSSVLAPIDGTDKVLLFAGDASGYANDTWLYNATQNVWFQQFPPESPPARILATASRLHGTDKVLLFGGWDGGKHLNDTWLYDVSDNEWTPLTLSEVPPARDGAVLAPVPGDDKALLFGGDTDAWPDNDTWTFDLSELRWTRKAPPATPTPYSGQALCPLGNGDRFVLFGGSGTDETWVYDLGDDQWTQKTPSTRPGGRENHALAPLPGTDRVLLFGGNGGGPLSDSWTFSLTGYVPRGNFTSDPRDLGGPSDLFSIGWNATVASGYVRLQLRTGRDLPDLLSREFMGPDGTNSTRYSTPGEATWSGHDGDRWIQYIVHLRSYDPELSPVLREVSVRLNRHPDAPEPLLPAPGGWSNATGDFSWLFRDNDSLNQSAYQLQVSNSSDFSSVGHDSGEVLAGCNTCAPALWEGAVHWRVRCRDEEGAWGPFSEPRGVVIDARSPSVAIVAPSAGLVNTTDFTLFGTAMDDGSGVALVEARADGGNWTAAEGTTNWHLDLSLPKGSHSVEVRAWDGVRNARTLRSDYLVNRPPSAEVASPPEGSRFNTTDRVNLTVICGDEDGDILTMIWRDGAVPIGTGATVLTGFGEGLHAVSVTVSDGRGHDAVRAVNFTVYITLPVPLLSLLAPLEGQELSSGSVSVNFTLSNFTPSPGGQHLRYALDDGPEAGWYFASPFTLAEVGNGRHVLRLWLVDGSGANLTDPATRVQVNFTVSDPRWNLPDLSLSEEDLHLSPRNASDGEPVRVTVRIKNGGAAAAENFTLRLYIDGTRKGERRLKLLEPGANSSVRLEWNAVRGNHTITVVVDEAGLLDERDEGNNEVSLDIQVGPARPRAAADLQSYLPYLLAAVAAAALAGGLLAAKRRSRRSSAHAALGAAGASSSAQPFKPLEAPFAVEDIFLIYRDGRLIQHSSRRLGQSEDSSEIMASMLTAVQYFIKDALSRGGDAVLGSMEWSGKKILLEGDQYLILAVVISGPEPDGLRCEMVQTLRNIMAEYHSVIPDWDGDTVAVAGTQRFLSVLGAFRAEDVAAFEIQAEAALPSEVKLFSEVEFYQGYARLKVGVRNEGAMLVADAALDLHFSEAVLRLEKVEPAYARSGHRVLMGNLGPKEKKTVALYLDPQMCTESAVDGVLTYRDAKGIFKTVPMKRRMVTVVCPILHTSENINTAMLKRMVTERLDQRDTKFFVVPEGIAFPEAFSAGKRCVDRRDVRFVREFIEKEPFRAEAWYYGRTKAREAELVIRVSVREDTRTLEFFVASISRLAVTGLLAELRSDLIRGAQSDAERKIEQVMDSALKEKLDAEKPLLDKYGDEGGGPTPEGPPPS